MTVEPPETAIWHGGNRRRTDDETRTTLDERSTRTPRGCTEWQGSTLANGYGVIQYDGRTQYAHRVAYELHVGPIPEGLHIDHLCRNRVCINPAHLEPVTQAENNRRARAVKTHCPHGHPLDGLKKHANRPPTRYCRTCNRLREARCRSTKENSR